MPRIHFQQQLAALALPPPPLTANPSADPFNGKTFRLEPNQKKIQALSFVAMGKGYRLTVKGDTASYTLSFGDGAWVAGSTTRSGPNLLTGATNHDVGLPAFKTAGSCQWRDPATLVLTLRYIESPHTETMICHVDGNNLTVEDLSSFTYGKGAITIKGTAQ